MLKVQGCLLPLHFTIKHLRVRSLNFFFCTSLTIIKCDLIGKRSLIL
ncbi:MAG: hypothetical protein ACLBM1_05150 [Cuspidothrix sp.]|nr:hypothetical protein [Cuspidothrix issatschenkoi]